MIFLGRNTPNNKYLDATNKKVKKVTWHSCRSISIMNLDQLIFIWEGWHLVLALFASSVDTGISLISAGDMTNVKFSKLININECSLG